MNTKTWNELAAGFRRNIDRELAHPRTGVVRRPNADRPQIFEVVGRRAVERDGTGEESRR